jgi:HlyD family secretion protein
MSAAESRLFRRAALERLASPEQLDHMIRTTRPRTWMGLLALVLLIGLSLAWAVLGSVPTAYSGSGMIVRVGGVLNVVARGAGLVLSVVAAGQHVKANQIIARIAQPELAESIAQLKATLDDTEREQEQALRLKEAEVKLQLEVLGKQRTNTKDLIANLEGEHKLAQEQVVVMDQLLVKGLITKQQSIAAMEKEANLQNDLATSRAKLIQFDAQEFQLNSEVANARAQGDLKIDNMRRNLKLQESRLTLVQNVQTPYSGEVIEVKVYPGSNVSQNAPILTIQPDVDSLEAIIYLPAADAKDAKPGMDVQLSPSNIKREEFGYIEGSVTYAANYPATPASLMRNFQNEAVVSNLSKAGPVTELRVALRPDSSTVSGFKWSSSKGPPIRISSGTLCTAEVITERHAPITELLPSLKAKVAAN